MQQKPPHGWPYSPGPQPPFHGYPEIRRPRRSRRRHFRWWLLLVPLVLYVLFWLTQGIQPAGTWNDIMDVLHVHDRHRYTKLAVLGVIVTTIVALVRVFRKPPEDDTKT